MKRRTIAPIALAATLLAALAPAAGAAPEELLPPGNSAVTQYTESLPTIRGHRNTDKGDKKRQRSPENTLGSRNAQKLEAQGPDGRDAAEAAAETAPVPSTPPAEGEEATAAPPTGNDSSGGAGGGKPPAASKQGGTGSVNVKAVQIEEPSGSSGFGEVLGEATGSSSTGQMGWLLPLLILATALWAVAYALRQRRQAS